MPVRLGAVSYLNARPCVMGLDRDPRFDLRFDVPARCAALLHEGVVDVGLIPSIEYLRGSNDLRIVSDIGIISCGPVASVALYTSRPVADIRSIALATSSRTSVALTKVLCARAFEIQPTFEQAEPDLSAMLARCDAALIIGDLALLSEGRRNVEKIDLGEVWTRHTGLPFVFAFWAGRASALSSDDVRKLQEARDAGVAASAQVARDYFADPALQAIAARYLRDNISYHLGEQELAGLKTFYRWAAELGLVPEGREPRFF